MTDSFTLPNSDNLDSVYYITNQCILHGEYDLASRITTFGEANFPGKFKLCSGAGVKNPSKPIGPVSTIIRTISVLMEEGEVKLALDICVFARSLYPDDTNLMFICADIYISTDSGDQNCLILLDRLESLVDTDSNLIDACDTHSIYAKLSLYWMCQEDGSRALKYINLALSIKTPYKYYTHACLHFTRYQIEKENNSYSPLNHDLESALSIIQALKNQEGYEDYENIEEAIIGFRKISSELN